MKRYLLTLICVTFFNQFLVTPNAHADTCSETVFNPETNILYTEAERMYLDKNLISALGILEQIKTTDLNCYEHRKVSRLEAAIDCSHDTSEEKSSCNNSIEISHETGDEQYIRTQPDYPIDKSLLISIVKEVKQNATCILEFNTDEYGSPFHIQAICDEPLYEHSAIAALSAAKFFPAIQKGEIDLTYKRKFKIEVRTEDYIK